MKGKPAHDSTYAVEGILLKMERLKQGKGQKEVCYGICVPSYLSKIEHAAVCPEREILAALFDRLDIAYENRASLLAKPHLPIRFLCLHRTKNLIIGILPAIHMRPHLPKQRVRLPVFKPLDQ